jgi:hypothetical protein
MINHIGYPDFILKDDQLDRYYDRVRAKIHTNTFTNEIYAELVELVITVEHRRNGHLLLDAAEDHPVDAREGLLQVGQDVRQKRIRSQSGSRQRLLFLGEERNQ